MVRSVDNQPSDVLPSPIRTEQIVFSSPVGARSRVMPPLTAMATGGVIGFALVFLGPPGLVLGLLATLAYARLARTPHRFERLGGALVGGGLVVLLVAGRVVVTSFADPAVTYEPGTAVAVVLGAIAAMAGAYPFVTDRLTGRRVRS